MENKVVFNDFGCVCVCYSVYAVHAVYGAHFSFKSQSRAWQIPLYVDGDGDVAANAIPFSK